MSAENYTIADGGWANIMSTGNNGSTPRTHDTPGVAGAVHDPRPHERVARPLPPVAEMSSHQRSALLEAMHAQLQAVTAQCNALTRKIGASGSAIRVPAFGEHNLPLDEQIERLRTELRDFVAVEQSAHQTITNEWHAHEAHLVTLQMDGREWREKTSSFIARLRWLLTGR